MEVKIFTRFLTSVVLISFFLVDPGVSFSSSACGAIDLTNGSQSQQEKNMICGSSKCKYDPSQQITLKTCGDEVGIWNIQCTETGQDENGKDVTYYFVPKSVKFNCTSSQVDMFFSDEAIDEGYLEQGEIFKINAINRHDSNQKKSKLYTIECGSHSDGLSAADTVAKGDGDHNCGGDPGAGATEPDWKWVNQ